MVDKEKLERVAHKCVEFVFEDHKPHWLYFPVKVTMLVPIVVYVKVVEIKENFYRRLND